ncbi:DUF6517 family protein [Natronobacterium texcoconense]|nr:DUF6517 family protein [Natronobacterium texcoconense]
MALSGCLGVIGMDEHTSTPAGVAATAREETGYEQTNVDEVVVEETVGTDALSEEVVVINHLTEHEKAVGVGPLEQEAAVFVVLSTPQIGLAGQQFNPVEEMSASELVDLLEDDYDDISNVSLEEESSITILEQSTTVSRFSADAVFSGFDLEVDLHVSEAVETDDDLVVTIGVYPQEVRAQEEENVHALMENVTASIEE